MKIKIYQDDEFLVSAEVVDESAIPDCMWAVQAHYGGGTYEARDENEKAIYRLTTEWME